MAESLRDRAVDETSVSDRRRCGFAARCPLGWQAGVTAFLALAWLVPADSLHADPIAVINQLRTENCGSVPVVGSRLRPVRELDAVAQALSTDEKLEAAFDRVAYPVASSASYHVRGSLEDAVIRRLLAERYCETINDPRYDEAGAFQRGDETWIVLALRQLTRPALEPEVVAQRVLELVNAARAEPRSCGNQRFAAAAALVLAPELNTAALRHARDMAARGVMGHEGSDGSNSADRIKLAGYAWLASGENVAAGLPDADAVVAAWLDSPGHCATLMQPDFTEMGIAFALAPERDPAIYWAQDFGTR
jgi:uncharacterized protein YkwD